MWEGRGDASTKAMILLLNFKNNNAKRDLCLLHSQGNKSAYPPTVKEMARYRSTQYPNKTIGHQHDKKEDKNGKKGNGSKPEDKDNNTTGTADENIGEVTTPGDSTAPSNRSSIGAHVLEVAKHKSWPAQSVEDLLGAHSIDDSIWGGTNPSEVSINTINSADIMVGSHIMEEQTFTLVDLICMNF